MKLPRQYRSIEEDRMETRRRVDREAEDLGLDEHGKQQLELLVAAVRIVLGPDTIDPELHKLQHEYVAKEIERAHNRASRMEFIQQTLIGTVIVSIVGGVLGVLAWIGKIVWQVITNTDVAQHVDKIK